MWSRHRPHPESSSFLLEVSPNTALVLPDPVRRSRIGYQRCGSHPPKSLRLAARSFSVDPDSAADISQALLNASATSIAVDQLNVPRLALASRRSRLRSPTLVGRLQ